MATRLTTALLLAVTAAGTPSSAGAEENSVTLHVTDRSNVKTEVTQPAIPDVNRRFIDTTNRIAVTVKSIELAIPVPQLISIEYTGRDEGKEYKVPLFDVKYHVGDDVETATGVLSLPSVTGDSVLGAFSLDVDKLQSVIFNHGQASGAKEQPATPPRPKAGTQSPPRFTAAIELADGTVLQLDDVQRHASYYYQAPAPVGFINTNSRTVYSNARNIILIRGDSTLTLGFERINGLTLSDDDQVSLVLSGGKKASATLSIEDGQSLDGFNGRRGGIRYFVPAKLIRSVELTEMPNN